MKTSRLVIAVYRNAVPKLTWIDCGLQQLNINSGRLAIMFGHVVAKNACKLLLAYTTPKK